MEKHPIHLKQPEFQSSEEVQGAVEKEQRRAVSRNQELKDARMLGPQQRERIPNDPSERIDAYIDRLEHIFLNKDPRVRQRNIDLLKPQIYETLIIKPENFPDSYFDLQKRVAREQGHGDVQITPDMKQRMIDTAIQDQKASLDAWIHYLSSDDAVYPAWFKYYTWTQITKLSQFDKERGEYKKRTDTTVAPFPDIYREPLAQIADLYNKVKEDNKQLKDPEVKELFSKKFPTLYAELTTKSLASSIENKEETQGEWVKYHQGQDEDAIKLFQSLEGKGTGWCTAGQSTAQTQIESGDFYVYYTNDKVGSPTQPRLAIRMNGTDKIGEIRGILPHQNIEPVMQHVLDTKLSEFGQEAAVYHKKSRDMRILTLLERKQEQHLPFTKDDLTFLYELNTPIEGFGYQKDPRIQELRTDRNTEEDMLIIFECTKDNIAHSPEQITIDTKVYVGPLTPGIFQRLPENLEHIYTSFPEKRITKEQVMIGGKSAKQLEEELRQANINITDYAQDMLRSLDFVPGKERESATLIRLTLSDLGFTKNATTDQIYARAKELGLELCPSDTGPNYRLQSQDQPLNEWVFIGMEQITAPNGDPSVFLLGSSEDGLWLYDDWASDRGWYPSFHFVFRVRPPKVGKQV